MKIDDVSKPQTLVAVVAIALLVALHPMAFASPPDQSWLGGFYDDADFDDVILIITGCCPAIISPATCDASPTFAVVFTLRAADGWFAPAPSLRSPGSRAPPFSA
jgi:hypothetical protein